jgi:hypothetical protein
MKLRVVTLGIVVMVGLALPRAAAAQASCTFAVDFPALRVGPAPDSATGRVVNSSTCAAPTRTVTSTVSWIIVSPEITTAPTTYTSFQIQGNSTGAARTGVVVIDGQAAITVTQGTAACVTAVTPPSAAFPVLGGEATFSVQTTTPDCYWNVGGFPSPPLGSNPFSPGWLAHTGTNVFGLTGHFAAFDVGSRSFAVAASINLGSGERTATLVFGGGFSGSGPSVTISQAAPTCQFTFMPSSITIPANGGSATVNLTGQGSDCSYTTEILSGVGDVTVTSGASGTAPASVTISMTPNPFPNERPARVRALNGVLSITQAGPPVIVDSGGGTTKIVGFGAARLPGGSIRITAPEPTRITNEVDPSATWTATASQPWIVLSPSAGTSPETMRISLDPAALSVLQPGTLSATVDIFSSVAPQTPRRLDVILRYYNGQPGTQGFPFGQPLLGFVDTPANGATGLTGSIAITGWAVDVVMVTGIKIYRDAVAGEAPGQVFIGDAIRVPGARPDLSIPYGGFPEWRMAGWGYLLLSNVLPDSGNGTFTFSAYADDIEGNHTLLGRRTVTVDNANATKPFGTIDGPAQGQTVSGTILNSGWALTPAGRMIPLDGTTIKVYVDGTLVGPVATYNVPRPDVKAYFPGLANSDGPEARLMIDTTQFADGVHTIAWGVVDDKGSAEGIGSRFFTVQNGSASQVQRVDTSQAASVVQKMPVLPTDVWSRHGVDDTARAVRAGRDASGGRIVRGHRGTRLEVFLDPTLRAACGTYQGHLLSGNVAGALPDGASLDAQHGIFRWQPTAGFIGTYRFVFVQRGCDGIDRRIPLSVVIG